MDLAIVIAVVVVALVFDYTNGFHDAANAIATSVSTRALTPRIALILAAVMNFVGALLGQEVAHTVSEVIDAARRATHGLVVVLAGAARRDHLEPDHLVLRAALVVLARADRRPGRRRRSPPARSCTGRRSSTRSLIPMVLSPLVGFALAFLVMLAIMWIFRRRNPHKVSRGFRLAQTVSAAALALGPRPPGRPEDDGRDLPGAGHRRLRRRRTTGLPLWVDRLGRRPRSRSAPTPAAGGSCAPSAAGSSTSTRRAASPPSRSARRCSTPRRSSPGPDLDHPHDHLGDHGRRRHQAALRRPLGRGPLDRDRLGAHLPDGRRSPPPLCFAS